MFKKLIALSLLSLLILAPATLAYEDADVEHMSTGENISPKVDLVKITQAGSVIQKENYLTVNFAQNFNSKYYKVGDYVQFNFANDIRTKEGTMLIPSSSSLIAKVSSIKKPRWFSRNARVWLEFTHIVLPDGTNVPVALQLAKNKKYLTEGAKETAGKIAAYTLAIGGFGTGLGAAIGVAAGNTITGVIIGGSVGGGVGLLTGIVAPGLHYKAKKGEQLILEVQDNLTMPAH